MKSIIFTIVLLMVTSVVASQKNSDPLSSMPLSKMFWSLFQERTIVGQHDCSNKCAKYIKALKAQGHDVEIVVILPHRSRFLHAIVKLTDGEKVTFLDPTKGIVANDLSVMGTFQRSITSDQFDSFGGQFK